MATAVYYVAYLRNGSVFIHQANPFASYEEAWRVAGLTRRVHREFHYFVVDSLDVVNQQAVEWRAMTHDGY